MLLALLMLLHMKRRVLYGALMAFAVIVSIPFLPASFTNRMDTIENYTSDESASIRIAVWKWTWDSAQDHPGRGGFDAHMGTSLRDREWAVQGQGVPVRVE